MRLGPTKINRESLQSQAKDAITQAILNKLFAPGDRVNETRIADSLTLSRSTVRAAIQELVHEGLLISTPRRGTIVMPLTAEGADELQSLREALERLAVQRAVRLRSQTDIDTLWERYQTAYDAIRNGDVGRSYKLDLALHQQVVHMAQHTLLASHYQLIEHKMLLYMAHAGGAFLTEEAFQRQHFNMVEGIAKGDLDQAMEGVNTHFREASELLIELFSNKQDTDGA